MMLEKSLLNDCIASPPHCALPFPRCLAQVVGRLLLSWAWKDVRRLHLIKGHTTKCALLRGILPPLTGLLIYKGTLSEWICATSCIHCEATLR